MTRTQSLASAVVVLTLILALGYLHDPPWAGTTTSGFRSWEEDPPGTLFRWTLGRATFFIPSDAAEMTLPLRSVFPGPSGQPTTVEIRVDDRWLATITLADPSAWVRSILPLGSRATRRSYRRIDLRINRTVGPYLLGVMTGEVTLEGTRAPRRHPRVGTFM